LRRRAPGLAEKPQSDASYADRARRSGQSYQIAVDSTLDPLQPGPFVIDLNFTPKSQNDHFTNRTPVYGTFLTWTNPVVAATGEADAPVNNGGWMPTLWWSWTAPVSGRVTLSTTAPYTSFGVYMGNSFSNLTEVVHGPFQVNFKAIGHNL